MFQDSHVIIFIPCASLQNDINSERHRKNLIVQENLFIVTVHKRGMGQMIISRNDNHVQNNCDWLNYPNNHQNTVKASNKMKNRSET